MKQQHSEEIGRREDRLDARLGRDSWPDKSGPVLAGGNEQLSMSRRVGATSVGGIGLVHRLVRQIGLPKLIDDEVQVFRAQPLVPQTCLIHSSSRSRRVRSSASLALRSFSYMLRSFVLTG